MQEEDRMIERLSRLTLITHQRRRVTEHTTITIVMIDDGGDEMHIHTSLNRARDVYQRALKCLESANRSVDAVKRAKQAEWYVDVTDLCKLRRLEAIERICLADTNNLAHKALEAQRILSAVERWHSRQI